MPNALRITNPKNQNEANSLKLTPITRESEYRQPAFPGLSTFRMNLVFHPAALSCNGYCRWFALNSFFRVKTYLVLSQVKRTRRTSPLIGPSPSLTLKSEQLPTRLLLSRASESERVRQLFVQLWLKHRRFSMTLPLQSVLLWFSLLSNVGVIMCATYISYGFGFYYLLHVLTFLTWKVLFLSKKHVMVLYHGYM